MCCTSHAEYTKQVNPWKQHGWHGDATIPVDDPLVLKHGNQYTKPLIDRWFSQLKPPFIGIVQLFLCFFIFSIIFHYVPWFFFHMFYYSPLFFYTFPYFPLYCPWFFQNVFSDATAEDWEACDCAHCRGSILGSTLECSVSSGVFRYPLVI